MNSTQHLSDAEQITSLESNTNDKCIKCEDCICQSSKFYKYFKDILSNIYFRNLKF